MQDALLSALAQGALLLTANRRLARHWRRVYDAGQQANGATAWPAPAIRAWPDWVNESIDALLPDRATPTPFAERREWSKIIDAGPLLDQQATAEGAAQAWALCQQYQLPLEHPSFDHAEDTAKFRTWAVEFDRRASRNRWLAAARREQWLAGQLEPAMREVWLDGFDEITPAQRALLKKLNHRTYAGTAQPASNITRASYPDARAEIHAAACWARTLLETRQAQTVGVVVQNLNSLRPTVEAVFEDVLGAPLFNISLGRPLTDWPIIADALLWLRWLARPLPIGEAGVLLRSPFFHGAEEEFAARAALDVKFRENNVLEVAPTGPPLLAESVQRATALLHAQARQQSPSAWSRLVPSILEASGWPGGRTQSSPERQALARWQQVLREFAALDIVETSMPFAQAMTLLTDFAKEAIFQPETAEMPVQILEALQAAGSSFDALWAMGMTDTAWPAPAKPNSFLPRALQRDLDLPHATPERELRFAREVTDRLLHSARTVIFSHPERDGDEELRASRLILQYPEAPPAANAYPGYQIAAPLDETRDATSPALSPAEPVRGGTSVLSWQSVCPFKAFATVRLQAGEWKEPEPGLSALERGNALHSALAALWKRFRTRAALARVSHQERRDAIAEAVEIGLTETSRAGRERLVELEHIRLRAVLEDWIELDFARDEFTVESIERGVDLTPAGPPIHARADRIDRLPGGELVLIDYKSTAPGKRVWSGERPDNLQLPLYAVALPETPSAIVFAQMKRGEHKFDGLAAAPGLMPGVKPPPQGWDAQLAEWRTVIARIWKEFTEGRAEVDPKEGGKPCRQCHLHSLCRVYDMAISLDAEEAG
ncbi:MAG: PD-(D/E)XK nuclease family protein [Bryobacterales bacterium]|nr:PD-(D/E)XK nuclease family protein [Bryobacterales bacterium]